MIIADQDATNLPVSAGWLSPILRTQTDPVVGPWPVMLVWMTSREVEEVGYLPSLDPRGLVDGYFMYALEV